jgi:transposase InsO family protein
MARSTFYYYLKRLSEPDKYQEEKDLIKQIFHANKGRYGYRRIWMELRREGFLINHKTVRKLMTIVGVKCMVRAKKYHSYKGEAGKIAPNLLQRNFHANWMNQKWVTDVTVFSLLGEKYYLSPIMDLFNREIISYSIASRPTFSLVTDMIRKAFVKIPDSTDLILHSDQGWHYQMKQYQFMLQQKGIRQSMSNKGNCLDNAVMENFFGLLKSELLYLRKFNSTQEFLEELENYIDYYNNIRIKGKLKGLSPVEYRTQSLFCP